MSESTNAVFLSYASQDAEVARRICEALRAAGIVVWFDQSELVGGDAWDRKIRGQIASCTLFVPVVSAATQARREGYFRIEWKLAAQRTHAMADGTPFVLPVVIDATRDPEALVPDEFRAVQWTKLPGGETSTAFVTRVQKLLGGPSAPVSASVTISSQPSVPARAARSGLPLRVSVALGAAVVALVVFVVLRPNGKDAAPAPKPIAETISAPALLPAATVPISAGPTLLATDKSVAVLAFANLSDDKANEYFSEGISEELLNVLAKVAGLKVSARTSAFHFKGKDTPIPEIAKQLGVAYVVEGSVRKAGNQVRITAQLIKAADGFHVWSDTFTRELKDVFAVQDEIAGLIAKNLSLKLGASSAASKVAVNPQAFELYVQGRQAWNLRTAVGFDLAESAFTRALAIEPNFARAHAALADVWMTRLTRTQTASDAEDQSYSTEKARIRAKITQALALDPDSAEAHASLGFVLVLDDKDSEAESALRRAVALNPNYASAHQWLAWALLNLAKMDEALEHYRLATELDPLSPIIWENYGGGLTRAGRLSEAIIALDRALTLRPNFDRALTAKSIVLVRLGRFTEAVALARQLPGDNALNRQTQLFVFAQAGLKAEAEALLAGLAPEAHKSSLGVIRGLLALGRTEEAMALMPARGLYHGDFAWNPIYDPVRDDPRWVKLLAEAGQTEVHARAQAWRKAHPAEKPTAR